MTGKAAVVEMLPGEAAVEQSLPGEATSEKALMKIEVKNLSDMLAPTWEGNLQDKVLERAETEVKQRMCGMRGESKRYDMISIALSIHKVQYQILTKISISSTLL